MNNEFILVLCTLEKSQDAHIISEGLINKRLCACVNIIPSIESKYIWNNKLETSSECILLIKTVKSKFNQIKSEILEKHKYENPEVISINFDDGSEKYLAWINDIISK